MKIKIFERYLAREIYTATSLVLLGFLMLFAFFDLIHELEDLGKGHYELHHAIGFVLLTLPGRLYELFPIGVLIGTLYALTTLARHSEITVLRTSGLSTPLALKVLAKISILFVIPVFLFGEFIAPPAEQMAQQLRLRAQVSVVAQNFHFGVWIKDGMRFINVRTLLPNTRLQGIRIYEFDKNYALSQLLDATEGSFQPPNHWHLINVIQTKLEANRTTVSHLTEINWQSEINPDILSVLLIKPDRMSLPNLYQYIQHLKDNHLKTQSYEIALWKKLIYPLAVLVMMALALPFAYLQERTGAVNVKVFAGVMLGITFHMLNGLFSSLGTINSWPPFFSAITPSVLFLIMAITMLQWSEKR